MPGPNAPYTNLDYPQVLKQSFDESTDRLRVDAVATVTVPPGGLLVNIQHTEDSVRLGDGTNYLTSTSAGGKVALDVNMINSISVIISHTDDSIRIGDGVDLVTTTPDGGSKHGLDVNLINQPIAVTQSGIWNITDILGTISLPTGAATAANQTTEIASLASIDGKLISQKSATPAITRVSSSATSVTLLSSNPDRLGAIFYNDSTKNCYLKFGATASSTSFTFLMTSGSTLILEENPSYTGRIDAIWTAVNGAMEVTELTL